MNRIDSHYRKVGAGEAARNRLRADNDRIKLVTAAVLKGSVLKATHLGEILLEVIFPALKRPWTEIVKLLGISRQMLYAIPLMSVSPQHHR